MFRRLCILGGWMAFLAVLAGGAYAENCMWDGSCENEKLNIDFCGNGVCDSFETKDSCAEDCESMVDEVTGKIETMAVGPEDEDNGFFSSVGRASNMLIFKFLLGVVLAVMIAVVLIALYDRIVETIEKED